jgi:hypothetical protein
MANESIEQVVFCLHHVVNRIEDQVEAGLGIQLSENLVIAPSHSRSLLRAVIDRSESVA